MTNTATFDEAKERANTLDLDALNQIKDWCQASSTTSRMSEEDQRIFLRLADAIDCVKVLARR